MRKPSPSMIVAGAALFVALGGVGVAATGGNFILGQPNAADKTTALSSGVTTGPTLEVSNSGNRPAAKFTAGNGAQPFTVNNGVKVSSLNVDKLDGLSSESFTQGGGRLYSGHRESVAPGSGRLTLLDIPGGMKLQYQCGDPSYGDDQVVVYVSYESDTNLFVAGEATGTKPAVDVWSGYLIPGTSGFHGQTVMFHVMGSRPFNRMTFQPAMMVDARLAGHWRQPTGKCYFQAVAEVFG